MALPTLLGRGTAPERAGIAAKPGPSEAEKGLAARCEEGISRPTAAEVASEGNGHEARSEDSGWISWQCLTALALSFLQGVMFGVSGWRQLESMGQTSIWALFLTTVFAGWVALWLWLIAPTNHIRLAARFLLYNWHGGLMSIGYPPESGIRLFYSLWELVAFQYLVLDQQKSFVPAFLNERKAPLWAICLGSLFVCAQSIAMIVVSISFGSWSWSNFTTWLEIAIKDDARPEIPQVPEVMLIGGAAVVLCFLIWLCDTACELCQIALMLRKTLRMTRDEANTLGLQAQLSCRRAAALQATGVTASSFTIIFVTVCVFLSILGNEPSLHLYIAAQCLNSVVNVLGVILLSRAHEILRLPGSARPPALPWFRCRSPCQMCSNSPKELSSKGSEWDMKTADLASRGIALSDLLAFYQSLGDSIMESFQPAVHTTNDVVRLAIIPLTSGTCSSYAQMVNDGKKVIPKKMVTHNWSNLFRDLLATVVADALHEHTFEFVAALLSDREGIKVVEEALKVQECLGETYWICAFAVNQHAGICGANPNGDVDPVTKIPHPICSCGTAKFFNTDPPLNDQGESIQCEMNKFDDMMSFLAQNDSNFGELVAVDADLNLFGRAWCIAELAEAHRMGMAQQLMLRNKETLMRRQGTLQGLQVEKMKASRPEDVEQILAKIPDKKAFNQKLQDLIFDGQVGLLAAWKKANVEQQMEDLSHVLKWARISESVPHGELIWRKWMA